ncbi:MAG: cytochrome ubiquinol oxidase subunit I, partial [Hydrogenobaculum sp.]
PLPFIASELGWMTAEIGRQPWIVTGMLKTADAVSFNSTSNVMFSVFTFVTIYILLFYVYVTTMIKKVREYEYTEVAPSSSPSTGLGVGLAANRTDLNDSNRIS